MPRLEDEVGGALFDRTDSGVHIAVGRNQYYHGRRVNFENPPQPLKPLVTAGHITSEVHVQHNGVVVVVTKQSGNILGVVFGMNGGNVLAQQKSSSQENVLVVVDYQYLALLLCHVHAPM